MVDENKGVKNNPKWCQNPQYLLNIPKGCVPLQAQLVVVRTVRPVRNDAGAVK